MDANLSLSVIIPFGTSKERPFIAERALQKVKFFQELKQLQFFNIEVIFVEGYSSLVVPELKEQIIWAGHTYIKDNTQEKFSQGKCRNLGVQVANACLVTFFDVDYYITTKAFSKLLEVIDIKGLRLNPNKFLILPCAFLTKTGTEYLLTQPEDKWDTIIQYDCISEKKNYVRFLSPNSSTIVISKHKYLEIGGNDKAFVGHGYEDFDLFYRLMISCSKPETLPINMSFDQKSWNFVDYKGFRSLLSVVGYESLMFGIIMVHLYHDEPNNDNYLDNKKINHDFFYNRIKKYKILSDGPMPLLDHNSEKRVLLFQSQQASIYRAVRGLSPYIGEIVAEDKKEDVFYVDDKFSPEQFTTYLKDHSITAILFPNPYGNDKRKEIYDYCREHNIKYYCFDRGAFPDSWFIDPNGFNYDSSSYQEELWNHELTKDEYNITIDYINHLNEGKSYLEAQGAKVGQQALRTKLGLPDNQKIAFIPLQTEDDAVIKYFTKPGFGFYEFIEKINEIAKTSNYTFIAKKHPLTKQFDKSKYPNIKFVADDCNIGDLISISDVVILINSGVGCLAMLQQKPCILCGNAFYAIKNVNYEADTVEDIRKYLNQQLTVDFEKVIRFVSYLHHFYCFGKSYYKTVNNAQGQNRILKIVNYINFYNINVDGKNFFDGNSAEVFVYRDDLLAVKPYIKDIKARKNAEKNGQVAVQNHTITTVHVPIYKKISTFIHKKFGKIFKH